MSFCQKRNQDSLKLSRSHSVWALKCSSPKICHSLLDHSVSRRGSEAHKQCNEGGVECGAHSWVCVCTCVCARVCVPAHTRVQPHSPPPTTQNPRGVSVKLVWSLNCEGQQPLCYGLFLDRPDHSFIRNFSRGHLTREARRGGAAVS